MVRICGGALALLAAMGWHASLVAADSLLAPSPVAHYTFDANTISGTSIFDVSGNGNTLDSRILLTGTIAGPNTFSSVAPTQVAGQFGGAVRLAGNNAFLQSANNVVFSSGFTVAGWVNRNPADDGNSIYYRNGQFTIQSDTLPAGNSRVYTNTAGAFKGPATSSFPANDWTHFAMTWTDASDTMRVYQDGVLTHTIGTGVGSLTNGDSGFSRFVVGGYALAGGYFANASFDELWLFDEALDQSVIQNLFELNSTSPPLAPEPGSLALMGSAIAVLGGLYWRRRRAIAG